MAVVNVSTSVNVSGGFLEGYAAYKQRWGIPVNSRPLPKFGRLFMFDAGSPVANFHPQEAFVALVALAHTGKLVTVDTSIGCGGTYSDYGGFWGLTPKPNPYWTKFYKGTGVMDRIAPQFAPISSGVYTAVAQRKRATIDMWLRLAPHLGAGQFLRALGFSLNVFEKPFGHMKVSKLAGAVDDGGVILSFPCPLCSHQNGKTAYHAIRRQGKSIVVTKNDRSPSPSGCKGAFPWKDSWNDLTIWETAYLLGARLYGKATYCMSANQRVKPPMMIRDYSNPRGTVSASINNWSRNIWISPRVYVTKNGGGTIEDFKRSIDAHPREWANLIQKFPLLGNGRRYDVTY